MHWHSKESNMAASAKTLERFCQSGGAPHPGGRPLPFSADGSPRSISEDYVHDGPFRPLRRTRAPAKCSACQSAAIMDATPEYAVRAERLTKIYKTAAAVDGISFLLPRGSITGLLGGNGAGK